MYSHVLASQRPFMVHGVHVCNVCVCVCNVVDIM